MKFTKDILKILLTIILFAGCATIKGNTVAEQRQYVLDMRDETLAHLYDDNLLQKNKSKRLPDTVSLATSVAIYFS